MLLDESDNVVGKFLPNGDRISQKDNAAYFPAMRKDQLAEVLVLCQKNSFFLNSEFYDMTIVYSRRDFRDRKDIVAGFPEGTNEIEITTFICQKSHRLFLGR